MRVSRSLLAEDKLTFAVRLTQIKLACDDAAAAVASKTPSLKAPAAASDAEIDALLRTVASRAADEGEGKSKGTRQAGGLLSEEQTQGLDEILKLPSCKALKVDASWSPFLTSASPEECVPKTWITEKDQREPRRAAFLELLAVKALRPDRLVQALERYVTAVFGAHFPWRGTANGSPMADLQHLVEDELGPNVQAKGDKPSKARSADDDGSDGRESGGGLSVVPVLLCAAGAGQDASRRVEALAAQKQVPLFGVSMGSAEGLLDAEKLVKKHAKAGGAWVLLRNVHLVPQWLEELEKKLYNLDASTSFRL